MLQTSLDLSDLKTEPIIDSLCVHGQKFQVLLGILPRAEEPSTWTVATGNVFLTPLKSMDLNSSSASNPSENPCLCELKVTFIVNIIDPHCFIISFTKESCH